MRGLNELLGSVCALIAAATVLPSSALAQAQTITFDELPARIAQGEFDVPESPAFFALGITPETVSRPGTVREFAIDVLNGLDKNGNFQSGLAIDTSPYLLIAGDRLTLKQYRDAWWRRFLANTTLSIATTQGFNDDDSTRASMGLRIVAFRSAALDPRMEAAGVTTCFTQALPLPPLLQNTTLVQREQMLEQQGPALVAALSKSVDKCLAQHSAPTGGTIEFGVAPTMLDGSDSNETRYSGTTAWASGSYRFERVEGVVTTRYKHRDHSIAPDDPNSFQTQDALSVAAQITVGSGDRTMYVEGAYNMVDPREGADSHGGQAAIGANLKISRIENTWLKLGVGWSGGSRTDERVYLLSTIKFGSGNEIGADAVRSFFGL